MKNSVFRGPRACRAAPWRTAMLALAAGAPGLALAQSAAPVPPSLSETVVTATRVPQPLADLVADVSVIDHDTIEKSGATGVADLLARLPGVEIARNGGVGSTTSVFLRGAETRFTAVYIDGVRVDSQSTGGATWEAIPLAQIDRIEVLRGPAAAVYGSDAIGGVIQIFTRKGEGGFSPYVDLGMGSNSTRHAGFGFSGSSGAFDYALSAAHDESAGFTAGPLNDGNPARDGYHGDSLSGRVGYQINPDQRLEASLLVNDMKSQYDDGSPYNPFDPVNNVAHYQLSTLGLSWLSRWNDVYSTRLSVSESNNDYTTTPDYYETRTRLRNYLFQNEFRFGAHLFTAALERREDALTNPATQYTPTLQGHRSQDGIALGYSYHEGPHTLQVNVRHDSDSQFGGKTTGSAAYGYAITPQWRVTASAGTSFRAPTLYQLYSQYGVSTLQPEQGRNVEAALHYDAGPVAASLTVYRNRVRNLINFDYTATDCNSFYGCYANVGLAHFEGVTLAGSYRVNDHLSLRGSLDVQNPHDDSTGNLLPNRARRHGTLGADWTVGRWTLGAELQAYSQRFNDTANTMVLPGYAVVNLSASTPIATDTTLVVRVDNATDRVYQLISDYATQRRSLYVGLRWQPK